MAFIGKIDSGNAADALDVVWQIVSLSIMIDLHDMLMNCHILFEYDARTG